MEYLWCRLETSGGAVRRVHVMHPSGEILASFSPERFEPALVARMQMGQVRARLSPPSGGGLRLLTLEDEAGRVLFEEDLSPKGEGAGLG